MRTIVLYLLSALFVSCDGGVTERNAAANERAEKRASASTALQAAQNEAARLATALRYAEQALDHEREYGGQQIALSEKSIRNAKTRMTGMAAGGDLELIKMGLAEDEKNVQEAKGKIREAEGRVAAAKLELTAAEAVLAELTSRSGRVE